MAVVEKTEPFILKVKNETAAKLWISDFCFVPGKSTVNEMDLTQYKFIKRVLENDETFKEGVEEKKLAFTWDKAAVTKFEAEIKEEGAGENKTK